MTHPDRSGDHRLPSRKWRFWRNTVTLGTLGAFSSRYLQPRKRLLTTLEG